MPRKRTGRSPARSSSVWTNSGRTGCVSFPSPPNPDGSPARPGYEYPVHQLLLELEKPTTGNKPQKMYVTVTRATDAGYSVDPIETYRRMAVEAAKEAGDEKLAEKIAGGSFGGGLKYNYGHCLYIFDRASVPREYR